MSKLVIEFEDDFSKETFASLMDDILAGETWTDKDTNDLIKLIQSGVKEIYNDSDS